MDNIHDHELAKQEQHKEENTDTADSLVNPEQSASHESKELADHAEAAQEAEQYGEAHAIDGAVYERTETEDDGEELSRIIEELCLSKAEEFAMLGYEGVTGKEIWEYVSEQYERDGFPPVHRLINDILSLRVTSYMNWLTLSAYKGIKFHE